MHLVNNYSGNLYLSLFFTFFYINRKTCCFHKTFQFPVFNGFMFLGCPKHDLTIFGKCVSNCVSVCMFQKFCGRL